MERHLSVHNILAVRNQQHNGDGSETTLSAILVVKAMSALNWKWAWHSRVEFFASCIDEDRVLLETALIRLRMTCSLQHK